MEKLVTDEAIQEELDIYNPMVPEPGQLCATMFIELTTDAQMREWLPKLVGIERSLVFRLPDGSQVRSITEAQHEAQLTRTDVTAAVQHRIGLGSMSTLNAPEEVELVTSWSVRPLLSPCNSFC